MAYKLVDRERLVEKIKSYSDMGISQAKISEITGVPRGTLYNWLHPETGRGKPSAARADLREINNKVDYSLKEYSYWRKTEAERQAEIQANKEIRKSPGVISKEDAKEKAFKKAWRRTGRKDSDFQKLYDQAERAGWTKEPNGAQAKLLEEIGLREPGANYKVGDTPENKRRGGWKGDKDEFEIEEARQAYEEQQESGQLGFENFADFLGEYRGEE